MKTYYWNKSNWQEAKRLSGRKDMKLFTGIAITILVIGFSFVYWGNYFNVRVDNLENLIESKTIVETGTYHFRRPYLYSITFTDAGMDSLIKHVSVGRKFKPSSYDGFGGFYTKRIPMSFKLDYSFQSPPPSRKDSMWVCEDTTDGSGHTTKNWKKVRRAKLEIK